MKIEMSLKKEGQKRIVCCAPCLMKDDSGELFIAMPAANEIIYLQRNGSISWDSIGGISYEFVRNLEPGESFTVTI